ncbi:MAG TPA: ATP-dependent helicase HrpB [Myxococcota bacterium]|nr:ATP-dependent helicase HrpB [Myxococcota bacterium]HRY92769.1 ATP-dependent helicase HrpB [Myxococcota bacterium]HSA20436.1 ATP-dependent helicase HrpB [Myxococcota bacterium]
MPPARAPLPIDAALPALLKALRASGAAVLTAPPGAGKSTRVPLALLEAGLLPAGQELVLLQPRRLAARAVARRLAEELGEEVGETVGHQVRFERRLGPRTRVRVVTEGILQAQLIDDPLLARVGAVLLDEFHERSVHADLALGCLREVREARPELDLVVMSATLEAEPIQRFLGGCPWVDCPDRPHPLEVLHLPQPEGRRLPEAVRAGLLALLGQPGDPGGDVLVFLPGAGEIRDCLQALGAAGLPGAPTLVPLYGALSAAEQDRAVRPPPPGQPRRVILATNLAETSLTVPGVRAVVDTGWVKRLRAEPRLGLDRLERGRVSRASADQRAGRAARLGPGRAVRLWSQAEERGLPARETPELLRLDLAQPLLAVLAFRPGDPAGFPLLDPPPAAAREAALELLRALGALPATGFGLTPRGARLARLPLHPRLGVLLLLAEERGLVPQAALLAALLGEREVLLAPFGRSAPAPTCRSDVVWRAELVQELEAEGLSPRAAERLGLSLPAAREALRARDQLLGLMGPATRRAGGPEDERALERLLLGAFPDRVCRRREPGAPEARMVGGRGVRLSEESGVREPELFLALSADAGARGTHAVSLVRQASALEPGDLAALYPEALAEEVEARFDPAREAVVGVSSRRYRDLPLSEQEGAAVDEVRAGAALAAAATPRFAELFQPGPRDAQLLARLRLAARLLPEEGWPAVDEPELRALLGEACQGRRSFAELRRLSWAELLRGRLRPDRRRALEQALPERLRVPSGREAPIDYAPALEPGGAPRLRVKLQEVFGLADSPRVARGRLALTLELLGPHGRPVQVTADLRSFWAVGYPAVRKELRGRYPRHPWPEDPWSAEPTGRAKPRKR